MCKMAVELSKRQNVCILGVIEMKKVNLLENELDSDAVQIIGIYAHG